MVNFLCCVYVVHATQLVHRHTYIHTLSNSSRTNGPIAASAEDGGASPVSEGAAEEGADPAEAASSKSNKPSSVEETEEAVVAAVEVVNAEKEKEVSPAARLVLLLLSVLSLSCMCVCVALLGREEERGAWLCSSAPPVATCASAAAVVVALAANALLSKIDNAVKDDAAEAIDSLAPSPPSCSSRSAPGQEANCIKDAATAPILSLKEDESLIPPPHSPPASPPSLLAIASASSTEGGGRESCGKLSKNMGLGTEEDMSGARGMMHESEKARMMAGWLRSTVRLLLLPVFVVVVVVVALMDMPSAKVVMMVVPLLLAVLVPTPPKDVERRRTGCACCMEVPWGRGRRRSVKGQG